HIDDARERDGATDLERPSGPQLAVADPPPARHPERQLAAGRMAERHHPPQVEALLRSDGPQMIDRRADVEEGARPPAAGIAQTPVLDVPGREALAPGRLDRPHHQAER